MRHSKTPQNNSALRKKKKKKSLPFKVDSRGQQSPVHSSTPAQPG